MTQFLVESSCIKLKIWAIQLKLSWKCEQLNLILIQVQNVNLKLNSIISLIELSCSHFQLDSSQVAYIFNLMWLNSTENWVNLIQLIKNLSLTLRELNIEIFPIFCFCIIFLHYLFALSFCIIFLHYLFALSFCIIFLIESHDKKHKNYMIESHEEKSW